MRNDGYDFDINKRNENIVSDLFPQGIFHVDHYRKGIKIGHYEAKNMIVNVGVQHILDCVFSGETQNTQWYMGLIDNLVGTTLDRTQEMSDQGGSGDFDEYTDYDETFRQEWSPADAVVAGTGSSTTISISNAAAVEFNINCVGDDEIYGLFICNDSEKDGTSGILMSTAAFSPVVQVEDEDQLKVTYTITASSAS